MPTTNSFLRASSLALALVSMAAASPLNPSTLLPREDATPLRPLDGGEHAQGYELRFQPLVDFDTDSCYNVPAIDQEGNLSPGLEPSGDVTGCRQASTLHNSNVYVRGRCNRGWCAFVYAYYFQMDWAAAWPFSKWNHRHDWEHVVVWAKGRDVRSASVSCHGEYTNWEAMNLLLAQSPAEFPLPNWDWLPADEATHPKVVFHKSGARTHCFRFGRWSDEPVENDSGAWVRGALIGWTGYKVELRDRLAQADFGSAHLAWHGEEDFTQQLIKTMPQGARDDGFDCAYDDYALFPGIPKQD